MSRLWGQGRGQVWLSVLFCPVTAQVGMDRQKTTILKCARVDRQKITILKDARADWLAVCEEKEDLS